MQAHERIIYEDTSTERNHSRLYNKLDKIKRWLDYVDTPPTEEEATSLLQGEASITDKIRLWMHKEPIDWSDAFDIFNLRKPRQQ